MAGHAFIVYSSYKQITCLRIPSLWRQTSSENILLCSLPYLLTWKKPAQVWDTFHHTRLYQLRFLLLLLCVCVWVWPVCSGQELNGLWSANSVRVCVSYSEVKWLVEQHHWLCVRAHAGVPAAVDRCVFLLTAVINGEHPWLGTKLLLNSLTFCVIASGQFAEEVRGSNGIRLEKYNYHFT